MNRVFLYLDNSHIFIGAKAVAGEREGGTARYRVRMHFRNLVGLGARGRDIERALAVGSIPPELRHVWNRLENEGVQVILLERGALHGQEVGVDQVLQVQMLRDALDHNGDPGIAVLLTGDGAGFDSGAGFHRDLERMHRKGWRIEVLSWRRSCARRMREWAESNGRFIALDDHYEEITFLEPPLPGQPIAPPREARSLASFEPRSAQPDAP